MILLNHFLKLTHIICLTAIFLHIQPASAQEWFSTFEERNGFSEFSPPNFLSDHDHDHDIDHDYKKHKQHWRSGSSFNDMNMFSYSKPHEKHSYENRPRARASQSRSNRASVSHANRNPWKPIKTRYGKQSFSSNRPWGKLPEQKPAKRNNMRFHDQRFKQWLNQQNHQNYAFDSLHVPAGFTYSNALYNSSMINPVLFNSEAYPGYQLPGGFVPFSANSPGFYNTGNGYYPVHYYPYSGVNNQPWAW